MTVTAACIWSLPTRIELSVSQRSQKAMMAKYEQMKKP